MLWAGAVGCDVAWPERSANVWLTTPAVNSAPQAKFLNYYIKNGIFPNDPFETLDVEGVGELVGALGPLRASPPELLTRPHPAHCPA